MLLHGDARRKDTQPCLRSCLAFRDQRVICQQRTAGVAHHWTMPSRTATRSARNSSGQPVCRLHTCVRMSCVPCGPEGTLAFVCLSINRCVCVCVCVMTPCRRSHACVPVGAVTGKPPKAAADSGSSSGSKSATKVKVAEGATELLHAAANGDLELIIQMVCDCHVPVADITLNAVPPHWQSTA